MQYQAYNGKGEVMDRKAFGKWIQEKRVGAGFTSQGALSRVSGVDHSTIARWERGDFKPRPENLQKVAPFLGVPYETLMAAAGYISGLPAPATSHYANGRKAAQKPNSFFKDQVSPPYHRIWAARLPLLAAIGMDTAFTDPAPDFYVDAPTDIHADFAVRTADDGMSWAGIREGDIALCRDAAAVRVRSGQIVAASLAEAGWNAAVRFYVEEQGRKLLRSANPAYKDIVLDGKEYRIAGLVVSFIKEPPDLDEYRRFLSAVTGTADGWASLLTEAAGVGLAPDDLKEYVDAVRKASHKTKT
jgi:repressor LexA